MTRLKLVFMGTPDFAVPTLEALIESGHEVACVYTQPPRPSGRGHKETPSPVHRLARSRGLSVRAPASLKDPAEHAAFAELDADAAVVAAYGLILPPPILAAPRLGCINVHASLLPRWRGAAPIQRAIMAGDEVTGVTIMQMDEGLDTGPILLAERVPITPRTTAGTLHDELADLGARLALKALEGLADGGLTPRPQPRAGATYARRIERGEERLDWRRPAAELERRVRALGPRPGAWFEHEGRRVRVLTAEVVPGSEDAAPGTVLDERLTVACGEGALRPLRLQREGRQALQRDAFLRGYAIPAGATLPLPA